ncbi:MAG: hypothetical protein M1816_006396 [Peltula sp. TS41687]|nr:MAG: hypothetical protein M1816_006396 [Peltula sp. TS41687]
MKQRFSSLDVRVIAHELSQQLVNLRLANVYDLSSRIFLFKFAKPERREQLVVESGFRCHLTSFSRTTAAAPSAFVARLRKFLRSRRITSVSQVGTDRILDIQFSDGHYRLFLEFYAAGNIILTDKELKTLAVFRIVSEGQDHEQLRIGLPYSLSNRQNYDGVSPISEERLLAGLHRAQEDQAKALATETKFKRKAGDALKKALAATFTEFPPMLLEHALRLKKFETGITPNEVLEDKSLQDRLLDVLKEAEVIVRNVTSSETSPGYIVAKQRNGTDTKSDISNISPSKEGSEPPNLKYEDFHPFKPQQFIEDSSVTILELDSFNHTVDEYFSSLEGQKLESRLQEREQHAKKKLDAARNDQAKRLEGLQNTQQLNIRKAQAIEANLEKVQEAINATNGLIAQGMDWVEIARLIEMEQSRQNPVAEMIKLPLKLYENTVTLLLDEMNEDDELDFLGDETESEVSDSDEENDLKRPTKSKVDNRLTVDIDLGVTPWANARQYYDQKRNAAEKEQKTLQQSTKAYKNMEKKITADLKKGIKLEKEVLRPLRQQFWFEKFTYFISSDGYLVLGGRDVQQDELLYKRHLKRGDIYVHANLKGAARVIIKNNPSTPEAPIPPSTLSQAGNLSVATSSAWENKAIMSAWWVKSDQVSKTATTGDYLVLGEFRIIGEKHFLAPTQLVLGFGVLFQISDESKAKHVKHRLHDPEAETKPGNADTMLSATSEEQNPGEDPKDPKVSDGSESEKDDDVLDPEPESDAEDDTQPNIERPNPLQPNSMSQPGSSSAEAPTGTLEDDARSDPGDEDKDLQHGMDTISLEQTAEQASESGVNDNSTREEETLHDPSQPSDDDMEVNSENNKTIGQQNSAEAAKAKPASQNRHVRGKHGKQRKLASKYADQDEEDRAIAMKLLASASGKAKAADDVQSAQSKQAEVERQKQQRREQHQQRAAKEGQIREEARQHAHAKEDDEEADEAQHYPVTMLSNLIGTPLAGDEILEALPVCAPWSAMTRYKYKIKLQPGQQKKGKAVKEILGRWVNQATDRKRVDEKSEDVEKIWPREVELVKTWKETEVVNVLPVGKVRVVLPAGGASGDAGKGGGGGMKGKGGGGGGSGSGSGRGGRGSKKQH